jgi:hypothetical protein
MIDNIAIIEKLLHFSSNDTFYHLQILKRKKEHPEIGRNSYVVKTYYISSLDYLNKKYPEIVELCKFHNARAYINLNPRSFETLAFQMLKKVTDQILNKDFKSVRKAYESVSGQFGTGENKSWIIDIDFSETIDSVYIDSMTKYIESEMPEGEKIIAKIPTKNGIHLITRPFRLDSFSHTFSEVDVHKNNPTLLYIP